MSGIETQLGNIRARGREAARLGLPRRPPYLETRGGKRGNVITWNRARNAAWLKGWDEAAQAVRP